LLTEHQLLLFWTQLFVLLVAARGLGALMRRVGQPPVIGELAAGLLLGPSVLGRLSPAAFGWLFPADPVQDGLLAAVAWLGVLLLLVVTGFETDLGLVRRLGRATARVTLGSLVVPAIFGLAVGFAMPDLFLGKDSPRLVFALLMATALSISALPVIAAVLSQLGLLRRSISQVMLAAAMMNDVVGWVLLGVVAGLAQSGSVRIGPLLVTLAGLAAFVVFAYTIGQRGVDFLLRRAREQQASPAGSFTITLLVALAAGCATQALGLEAVLGAFIAGTVLGRSKFQDHETFAVLERVTGSFLAPLFFARAGLGVDLGLLAEPQVALWGVVVLAAASLSKFGGAYLGGWSAGLPVRERLALGAGLNARGAVEIVVATVGLSLGVLNESSYGIIVLMAMATSIAAPPILRIVLRGWAGSEEEQERLERERMLGGNVLVRASRVLLPSHGGPNSILAAQIVDLAWPQESEVTILSAGADVPADDLAKVRAVFTERPVVHEHEPATKPLAAILKHSALGYGAIAVGATDVHVAGRLVSPVIDDLLGASPLPVVMVRRGALETSIPPPAYRRILVPAIGTAPGRAAQEMAFSVARKTGAQVLIAHVVTSAAKGRKRSYPFWNSRTRLDVDAQRAGVAERVLEDARVLAEQMGVHADPVIRTGVSASQEILALARERQVDLLVVAANLRQLSGRPFLGHGVEDLLEEAECTLLVVTAPPGWAR
jgi:Kef-type K+ transport system membrane component KefB/nucleotide-binding universal stress UspA family protein